jgi:hypothetical protein
MRRKLVSEKTLELNVAAAMLDLIRTGWPGCASAFWIGMKQYQEARNGIDELLSNMPRGRHLALQFKAPSSRRLDTLPYEYGLGEDQMARLLRLATTRPRSVFYVFPHYNTFTRMRNDSPDLLRHTYLLPVARAASLAPVAGGARRHRAQSWEVPPSVVLYSDPLEVESLNAKQYLTDNGGVLLEDSLLSNSELEAWLRQVAATARDKPSVIGQRLRGFSTVCVPGR